VNRHVRLKRVWSFKSVKRLCSESSYKFVKTRKKSKIKMKIFKVQGKAVKRCAPLAICISQSPGDLIFYTRDVFRFNLSHFTYRYM
jgi:hypothetical protein